MRKVTKNELRAPQALTAVEALIAGAIAHGHAAAVWAGGCVQLVDEAAGHRGGAVRVAMAVSVAATIPMGRLDGDELGLFAQREVRNRPVDRPALDLNEASHRKVRLGQLGGGAVLVARNKLA